MEQNKLNSIPVNWKMKGYQEEIKYLICVDPYIPLIERYKIFEVSNYRVTITWSAASFGIHCCCIQTLY